MSSDHFILSNGQYLSDLDLPPFQKKTIIYLQAPTGAGKTTFFAKLSAQGQKVIIALPYRVSVTQAKAIYEKNDRGKFSLQHAFVYGESKPINPAVRCIFCTYDMLPSVMRSLPYPKHWSLVIDEAHNLYKAGKFRNQAITNVVSGIESGVFRHCVLISAELSPDFLPIDLDHSIHVKRADPVPRRISLLVHESSTDLTSHVCQLKPKPGNLLIIRINNKKLQQFYAKAFAQQKQKVLVVNKVTQQSEAVSSFLEDQEVPEDVDIVLTTSLLDEAINIKNRNVEGLYIVGGKVHSVEIVQFLGRVRLVYTLIHLLERQHLELQQPLCVSNSVTPIMSNARPAQPKANHQYK